MKNMRTKILSAAGAAFLLSFLTVAIPRARAQYAPPQPQQGSPYPQQYPQSGAQPGSDVSPGVARVSFIRGDVSVQRGDSGETSAATLNTPLVAGDKISTGDNSRTELQLDFADVLRLDERAQANVVTLDNNRIQLQLADGLANFSSLDAGDSDVEIDTPNVALRPVRGTGQYRIQVSPNGDTFITVRQGAGEVSTPEGSTNVQAGDLITIHGSGNDITYQILAAARPDAFDNWNSDRDRIITDAQSVRDTNRYYTGAEDLDGNGTWSEIPDYGRVWRPRVNAGWAPYRDGRWVWEPYYGWTWVSDESWGWAPYHYGRWFDYDGDWVWWPGPVQPYYRPVWAPAYVSFFGFGGGGFNFGVGFGSIGWIPIGPCDYYHPWYGGYRSRYNVVNVTNIYNVHEGFAPLHGGDRFSNLRNIAGDDRVRRGISSVDAGHFGQGGFRARGVSAADIRGGQAMTGNLPVSPTRASLRASDRAASPSTKFNDQARFFSRGNAPGGVRQGNSGPVQSNNSNGNNGGFQHFGQGGPVNGGPQQRQNGGFNRQGSPQSAQSQAPTQNQGLAQGGWQRFGRNQDQRGPANATQNPAFDRQAPTNGAPDQRRSAGSNGRSSQPYREPLDLNRPIVRERTAPAPSGGGFRNEPQQPGGDYRRAPIQQQAAPNYREAPPSAPSRNYAPAPSYRSAPAPSGGGGNRGGFGGGGGGNRGGGSSNGGGNRGGGRDHGR